MPYLPATSPEWMRYGAAHSARVGESEPSTEARTNRSVAPVPASASLALRKARCTLP